MSHSVGNHDAKINTKVNRKHPTRCTSQHQKSAENNSSQQPTTASSKQHSSQQQPPATKNSHQSAAINLGKTQQTDFQMLRYFNSTVLSSHYFKMKNWCTLFSIFFVLD
jgi:hypothetical protein